MLTHPDGAQNAFRLRLFDHIVVLCGGAIGGHLAVVIVALAWFPNFAPRSGMDLLETLLCFPLGAAIGYLPGILPYFLCARIAGKKWIGFLTPFLIGGAAVGYGAFVGFAGAAC